MTNEAVKSEQICIALGSNLGDRLAHLRAGVAALAPYVPVTAKSHIYETAPLYVTDQPAFLNAAVIGTARLEPLTLLHTLKKLETELGRAPSLRYGPRAIDMDIIFYGQRIIMTPELTLPHTHMAEREFVLRPVNDIAPGWQHPQSGLTIAAMLERLPEIQAVRLSEDL